MRYKKPQSGWIEGGSGYIPLSRGLVAIVDPEMVAELEQHNWHASKGGSVGSGYYAYRRARGDSGRVTMHRYVLWNGLDSSEVVDHINHNTLDNRRSNLRAATVAQNGQNRRMSATNKTGYKGVS